MRKFTVLVIIFVFGISLCGCSVEKTEKQEKAPVVINLASDDSVNGYRKDSSNNAIKAEDVAVSTGENTAGNSTNSSGYCVNKNSKVLHKLSCGSVSKMKAENKGFYSSKEAALADGYKPCGSCKP